MFYLIFAFSIYLIFGGFVFYQWVKARALARYLYSQYIEEGVLHKSIDYATFANMFMRCEGPRLGQYLFFGGLLLPLILVASLNAFNYVWDFVWDRTGQLDVFDIGELPHSLMLVFVYTGISFALAWGLMHRYHKYAPGSLKSAIRGLNQAMEELSSLSR